MSSHAVKYAVCVLFACVAAAVALAVSLLVVAGLGAQPARAQVAPEEGEEDGPQAHLP